MITLILINMLIQVSVGDLLEAANNVLGNRSVATDVNTTVEDYDGDPLVNATIEDYDGDQEDDELEDSDPSSDSDYVARSLKRRSRRRPRQKPRPRKKGRRKTPEPHKCKHCGNILWSSPGHTQFRRKRYCPHAPG